MSKSVNDVFEIVGSRLGRTTSRLLLRRHCVALPFFICREKKKKKKETLGLADKYIRGYKEETQPRSCRLYDKIDHDHLTAWRIFDEERGGARLSVSHGS